MQLLCRVCLQSLIHIPFWNWSIPTSSDKSAVTIIHGMALGVGGKPEESLILDGRVDQTIVSFD